MPDTFSAVNRCEGDSLIGLNVRRQMLLRQRLIGRNWRFGRQLTMLRLANERQFTEVIR